MLERIVKISPLPGQEFGVSSSRLTRLSSFFRYVRERCASATAITSYQGKNEDEITRINMTIPASTLSAVDLFAAKLDMSRSAVIRMLVDSYIDEMMSQYGSDNPEELSDSHYYEVEHEG